MPPHAATPGVLAVRGSVAGMGIGLSVTGVVLVAIGLVTRLAGGDGALLSMDAPGSLARLFISAVLAVAALVAALGVRWRPGRRAWWLGVAVIAGVLAATKVAGHVHTAVVAMLGSGIFA